MRHQPRTPRAAFGATLAHVATKATTAWGEATVLEEIVLPQDAGEKRFTSVVQLLEGSEGELYVRFAYATDGTARRGPVTLRPGDLELLREALAERPRLAAALPLARAERKAPGASARGNRGGGRGH